MNEDDEENDSYRLLKRAPTPNQNRSFFSGRSVTPIPVNAPKMGFNFREHN
jgi:hypothetical protein